MQPNWDNRTLFVADNYEMMLDMDDETVDLIYLDPPFNSKREYTAPLTNTKKLLSKVLMTIGRWIR